MAQTLSTISTVSFILAAVCFVLAVYLFIRFRIPEVVGDLSGKTARKSIEAMRAQSARSSSRPKKKTKTAPPKNTDRAKAEKKPAAEKAEQYEEDKPETGLLDESLLRDYSSEATSLLDTGSDEVFDGTQETVFLGAAEESANPARKSSINIEILEEVVLVHTEDSIF